MGANTEMSRLDSIPTEKLNDILGLDTDTLGEIPAPESTDNGKVLGVADGGYALVNGGGGGGAEPLIVNITESGIDATYNEIKAAVLAGRAVYALYKYDSESEHEASYFVLMKFKSNEIDGSASYEATFQGNSFIASDPDEDMIFPD